MMLSEYSDDDLLEEVKHRGFKIEIISEILMKTPWGAVTKPVIVRIGGISFDLK